MIQSKLMRILLIVCIMLVNILMYNIPAYAEVTPTPTVSPVDTPTPVSTPTPKPTSTPLGNGSYNAAERLIATTSRGSISNIYRLTDGDTTMSNYVSVSSGPQWIQLDLGSALDIGKVKLLHYLSGRTYHDVIVQFSNDPNFATGVTTVFNNDLNNDCGQGIGTDSEYAEVSYGKSITFNTVNARYFRTWTNGYTSTDGVSTSAYNYYVEVEVWTAPFTTATPTSTATPTQTTTPTPTATPAPAATPTPTATPNITPTYTPTNLPVTPTPKPTSYPLPDGSYNAIERLTATSSKGSISNAYKLTDGDKVLSNYTSVSTGKQWIQFDMGTALNINKAFLLHFTGPSGRYYHDVILQFSNDPNFLSGVTTVFNNDVNNDCGQGAGTDAEYLESSEGKDFTFPTVNARYFRVWSNGNTVNSGNYYVEVEVWTAPGVPLKLDALVASNLAVIKWDLVSNASEYTIEVDGQAQKVIKNTSYIHSNLLPNTQHTYRVKAKIGDIYDNWSPVLTKTTPLETNLEYIYDPVSGRLVKISISGKDIMNYTYDNNGNLLKKEMIDWRSK